MPLLFSLSSVVRADVPREDVTRAWFRCCSVFGMEVAEKIRLRVQMIRVQIPSNIYDVEMCSHVCCIVHNANDIIACAHFDLRVVASFTQEQHHFPYLCL